MAVIDLNWKALSLTQSLLYNFKIFQAKKSFCFSITYLFQDDLAVKCKARHHVLFKHYEIVLI